MACRIFRFVRWRLALSRSPPTCICPGSLVLQNAGSLVRQWLLSDSGRWQVSSDKTQFNRKSAVLLGDHPLAFFIPRE